MIGASEFILAASDKPQWLYGLGELLMGIGAVCALIAARNSRKTRTNTDNLQKQMVPNGGSSLRDAVNRLEVGQQRTHDRLDGLDSRMTTLEDIYTEPPKRTTPTPRKKAS